MTRHVDLLGVRLVASDDPNPFVRYRQLFRGWHLARAAGWSDDRYVGLVRRIDDAIAAVDGHGFRVTPTVRADALSTELGFDVSAGVWIKDETGGVAGSHKARHLMGILLEVLVAEERAPSLAGRPFAIASCGNAALAAAVVARAAGRRIEVFVPTDADSAVLDRLTGLGAVIESVARHPGESGDPTVARLRTAVAAGAIPFTCQGPENGLAIEGGQTLGYELAEAIGGVGVRLDRVVVQVGGGALASAVSAGLAEARALGAIAALPRLDTVQTPVAGRFAGPTSASPTSCAGVAPTHAGRSTFRTPRSGPSSRMPRIIAPATCGRGTPPRGALPTGSWTTRPTTGWQSSGRCWPPAASRSWSTIASSRAPPRWRAIGSASPPTRRGPPARPASSSSIGAVSFGPQTGSRSC
ncbi:MAG: pyridoxal-phosphate dependent enzyme [Chloroflexi bacterium]|nr:pyridoxal-phosphate dependent enzyme [Chloroflexota bacterium]